MSGTDWLSRSRTPLGWRSETEPQETLDVWRKAKPEENELCVKAMWLGTMSSDSVTDHSSGQQEHSDDWFMSLFQTRPVLTGFESNRGRERKGWASSSWLLFSRRSWSPTTRSCLCTSRLLALLQRAVNLVQSLLNAQRCESGRGVLIPTLLHQFDQSWQHLRDTETEYESCRSCERKCCKVTAGDE